jgi:predicted RNA-binding protein with PUA-like domain
MNYWLMKSEPFKYSWDNLVTEGTGTWDGVRNYAARLNLMSMKVGDLAFFYHSNEGLEIVGIVQIVKEHYPDPTTTDPRWVVVDIQPWKKLSKPVKLSTMKTDERLKEMDLLRIGRLSVGKVTKEQFDIIIGYAETD